MSKFLRLATVITAITFAASMAQAQSVGMAGEYSEGNGIIVNIPQNPPLAACDPAKARCVGKRDLTPADLITTLTPTFGTQTTMVPPATSGTANAVPFLRDGPSVGVLGARNIATIGGGNNALAVGGQFTVPTLAFTQRLGNQVGQVLNNIVVQLDTDFTAAMPGTAREKNLGEDRFFYTITAEGGRGARTGNNPAYVTNPDTRIIAPRVFSVANTNAFGQNNGEAPNVLTTTGPGTMLTPNPNYRYREAINTSKPDVFAADELNLSYSNANPTAFSGTMTILLDGSGRLYLASNGLDANFSPPSAPNGLAPIVGTNPVGDTIPGFNDRNAGGWDITAVGRQLPGRFKAFGPGIQFVPTPYMPTPVFPSMPNNIPSAFVSTMARGTACGMTAQNDTCNLIAADFENQGITLAPLAGADSTKFMFAWTTGTVSIVRTGPRQGVVRTLTQTGMGYDTITGGGDRNVGLVAGSYTKRVDGTGLSQMNTQMAGIDLKFTPEPGATVALISGLGLLGALGARRRS